MRLYTIGILGGMGPRATVFFEQKLMDRLTGNDQQLPRILSINDGYVPDRTDFLNQKGEDPVPRLLNGASLLASADVDIVCMPCNTAHAPKILNRLQALISLPVIDMPACALLAAEQAGYKRLLILGTEGTKASQVYDLRSVGTSCIYPNKSDQRSLNQIICYLKIGQPPALFEPKLAKILSSYVVDAVVIACTELSMMSLVAPTKFPVIDALDALVNQCIMNVDRYNRTKGVSNEA